MDVAANRTPLMTSEIAANHNSLYCYHDNRKTPAAYGENKRLFGGIYDERKSWVFWRRIEMNFDIFQP